MDQSVPQYLRDHARLLRQDPVTIADTTLRYGSGQGLALLAAMASDGRCGYDEVLAQTREVVASGRSDGHPPLDVNGLIGLARVKAGWPGPGLDFSESADLHQAVRLLLPDRRTAIGRTVPHDLDRLDAQTNLAAGRIDYVDGIVGDLVVIEDSRWMIATDLAHPAHGRPGSTEEDWLRSFNSLFARHGLLPAALSARSDASRFDRLISTSQPATSSAPGPMVTVVMSVFRPDQSLITSLRSMASQTWPHLEVLVVDDCSPLEFHPLIDEAVAMDDRFELVRMPQNGGTYKIRNAAMARARGEFIAFQDSDDWSHPERIERQLRPLLDDPELVATMSRGVRVDEELGTSKVGFGALRQNASSLLFRREPVLAALGGYDEVRKAADWEFTLRMFSGFGRKRVRELELPLALVQLTRESLSRGDFLFGWRDANRLHYREAYEHWHAGFTTGVEARLRPGPPRPYPAPPAFLGAEVPHEFDVVLVSDWRQGMSRYEGGPAEAAALADADLKVAAAHAETMRFATRQLLAPATETMDLRASGDLTPVRWEDPLRAGLVLVHDPELLSYPRRSGSSRITTDRVVIAAAHPPVTASGDLVYDPAIVARHARDLFGTVPEWLPGHEDIASALAAAGCVVHPPRVLAAVTRPGGRAGLRGGNRPVVGATADAYASDPPTWWEWMARFPDDDAYDVRIRDLGGTLAAVADGRLLPPNWLVTAESSDAAFVGQLDFLVGMPIRSTGPEPLPAVLSAMAQGCVVILDRTYEPLFGGAALYLDDVSPRQVIDEVLASPARHRNQQSRGHDLAAQLSPQAFRASVEALLPQPEEKRS
jgi:glycosyltransferase involved in cell wall biosynthesis